MLEKIESEFTLTTSNLIHENEIPSLQKHIEEINSLSPRKLKILYQNILINGIQKNNNTGLGLIAIRRKSVKPLSFKFVYSCNKYSLFTVKAIG